jgi:hypothetical protein
MSDESQEPRDPSRDTWGNRHAVTILTAVLFGLLAFVMMIQVAC